jgi:tetratricopeptide (TPR) repeat protein
MAVLEEALEAGRRRGSRGRSELAPLLSAQGYAHQVAGREAAARASYEQALAMYRTLPADSGDQIERILVNLGWLAGGDAATAAARFREVLERRVRRLGPDHSLTARTRVALASTLLDLDSLDLAERLAREALAVHRRLYPEPHADLAESLSLSARILARRGRAAEAELHQREAVAVSRRVYGERNAATAKALSSLANLLQTRGRLDEAAELNREAAARYRELLGPGHLSTAVTLTNLAYTEYLRHRLPAAESLYRQAVPVLDSAWRGTARIAPTLVDFGVVLLERRQLLEAEPRFRRALELERSHRPAGHVDVIRSQRYLGNTLAHLGRFAEAEPLLLDAHRQLVAGWGATNRYTVAAAGDLERFYRRWGKPALAASFRSR